MSDTSRTCTSRARSRASIQTCQQVVRQAHRLGALQMGVAGNERVDVLASLFEQRVDEASQAGELPHQRLAQVQQHIGRDLVIPAAGRVHARAGVPRDLRDPPLDRRVDVLVGRRRRELIGRELLVHLGQRLMTDSPSSPGRIPQLTSMLTWATEPAMSWPTSAGRSPGTR